MATPCSFCRLNPIFFLQAYRLLYGDKTNGHFDIFVNEQMLNAELKEKLKLTSQLSTNRMHLMDKDGKIKTYGTPEESKYNIHEQKQ